MTSYQSLIVSVALFCPIFKLFDVQKYCDNTGMLHPCNGQEEGLL